MKKFLMGAALVLVQLGCGGTNGLGAGYSSTAATDTCASGAKWTAGTQESEFMNPGYACRSCHLGQNFQGQNPTGQSESRKAYFFMGTVYSAPHQEDLCAAANVPADAQVEILDMDGGVQVTMKVNEVGNFRSTSTQPGFTLPYRAQVRANGKVNVMGGAQMTGDCNTCHTAAGLEGAPGRIFYPQ